jgi:hypothetical protein
VISVKSNLTRNLRVVQTTLWISENSVAGSCASRNPFFFVFVDVKILCNTKLSERGKSMRTISFGQTLNHFEPKLNLQTTLKTSPAHFSNNALSTDTVRFGKKPPKGEQALLWELFSRFQAESREELTVLGLMDIRLAPAPDEHLQLLWNQGSPAFKALVGVQKTLASHYGTKVEIVPSNPTI